MNRMLFLCLFFFAYGIQVFAQSKDSTRTEAQADVIPIPIEVLAMDKGFQMEMVMNKKIKPGGRFGAFVLTEYYGDYNLDDQQNDYIIQTYATYDITADFMFMAGSAINNATGFSPSIGFQYALPVKDFFFLFVPRLEFWNKTDVELMSFMEYRPQFNDKWGMYSRIEVLYNEDLRDNAHNLSYIWLRLGLSYKNFQFGLASNFERYGPDKSTAEMFGLFLRTELF